MWSRLEGRIQTLLLAFLQGQDFAVEEVQAGIVGGHEDYHDGEEHQDNQYSGAAMSAARTAAC
jgi:hypothetical protein